MRWKLGGNLEPVRVICEVDWKECPGAVVNYVWTEIVTDVLDCLTNEAWTVWRALAGVVLCALLLRTLHRRTRRSDENALCVETLNRVGCKVQDLELKVGILTYKMQYGAWPLPHQMRASRLRKELRNVRLTLSSSDDRNVWIKQLLLSPSPNSYLSYSKVDPRPSRRLGDFFDAKSDCARPDCRRKGSETGFFGDGRRSPVGSDESVERSRKIGRDSQSGELEQRETSRSENLGARRCNTKGNARRDSTQQSGRLPRRGPSRFEPTPCGEFLNTVAECKHFLRELESSNKCLGLVYSTSETSGTSVSARTRNNRQFEGELNEETRASTTRECVSNDAIGASSLVKFAGRTILPPALNVTFRSSVFPNLSSTNGLTSDATPGVLGLGEIGRTSRETLHHVRRRLESLHNVLRTYGTQDAELRAICRNVADDSPSRGVEVASAKEEKIEEGRSGATFDRRSRSDDAEEIDRLSYFSVRSNEHPSASEPSDFSPRDARESVLRLAHVPFRADYAGFNREPIARPAFPINVLQAGRAEINQSGEISCVSVRLSDKPAGADRSDRFNRSAATQTMHSTSDSVASVRKHFDRYDGDRLVKGKREATDYAAGDSETNSTRQDGTVEWSQCGYENHCDSNCNCKRQNATGSRIPSGNISTLRSEMSATRNGENPFLDLVGELIDRRPINDGKMNDPDARGKHRPGTVPVGDRESYPVAMETDEDIVTTSEASSRTEVTKSSDTEDASTVTLLREALKFKKALLNRARANETSPGEDASRNDEEPVTTNENEYWCAGEADEKSKLLDMIAEEQSGSSSTDKTSRTYIFFKMSQRDEVASYVPTDEDGTNGETYFRMDDADSVRERVGESVTEKGDANVKDINELVSDNMESFRDFTELFSQSRREAISETRRAIRCQTECENAPASTMHGKFDASSDDGRRDDANLALKRNPGIFSLAESSDTETNSGARPEAAKINIKSESLARSATDWDQRLGEGNLLQKFLHRDAHARESGVADENRNVPPENAKVISMLPEVDETEQRDVLSDDNGGDKDRAPLIDEATELKESLIKHTKDSEKFTNHTGPRIKDSEGTSEGQCELATPHSKSTDDSLSKSFKQTSEQSSLYFSNESSNSVAKLYNACFEGREQHSKLDTDNIHDDVGRDVEKSENDFGKDIAIQVHDSYSTIEISNCSDDTDNTVRKETNRCADADNIANVNNNENNTTNDSRLDSKNANATSADENEIHPSTKPTEENELVSESPSVLNLSSNTSASYADACSNDRLFPNASSAIPDKTASCKLDSTLSGKPTRSNLLQPASGGISKTATLRIQPSGERGVKRTRSSATVPNNKNSKRVSPNSGQQKASSSVQLREARDKDSSIDATSRDLRSTDDARPTRSPSQVFTRSSESSPRISASARPESRAKRETTRESSWTSREDKPASKCQSRHLVPVPKVSSRSCIPILKTRLDAARQTDRGRSKSPARGPLTMTMLWRVEPPMSAENASETTVQAEGSATGKDKGRGQQEAEIGDRNELVSRESIASELYALRNSSTVRKELDENPKDAMTIYMNIITSRDHSIVRIADPKPLLEYLKSTELKIRDAIGDDRAKDLPCGENNSSAARGEHRETHRSDSNSPADRDSTRVPSTVVKRREMEVTAKPSVMDTSTSISGLPDAADRSKSAHDTHKVLDVPSDLTKEQYASLLRILNRD